MFSLQEGPKFFRVPGPHIYSLTTDHSNNRQNNLMQIVVLADSLSERIMTDN